MIINVSDKLVVQKALEYVERVQTSECTGGNEEQLPIKFDHSEWDQYALISVKMANLITKMIIRGM